jgi:oxaloacetate decarboxylase (Na+ extruding) subunit alpha
MKTVSINDITVRDIFQNIDLDTLDKKSFQSIMEGFSGLEYDSLEIMGGSSFEKMLESRLNINPFQVTKFVKSIIPAIPLQALIGARNMTGLELYSNNIIEKFIKQSIDSGISIFRVYDSLNDLKNMEFTVGVITKNNADCQGTIIYDDHQKLDYYHDTANNLVEMGCSSICIKDAESTMLPKKASELFKFLSQKIKAPVYFSASNLRGLQTLNYFEAVTNGCSGVDLSFLPSSYNDFTSTVFPFLLSMKDTDVSYKLDYDKVVELGEIIKKYVFPHIKQDLFSTKFILNHANKNLMPKWLITNIEQQLVEIGEEESLDAVLEEVFRIKSEIGNPSLSTPVGQIIGSQAVLNSVISDHRWEILCDEIKKLIWGEFGKLPRKISKEVLERLEVLTTKENGNNKQIIEVEDTYKQCTEELASLSSKSEDILSYCISPDKTKSYLEHIRGIRPAAKIKSQKVKAADKKSSKPGESVSLSGLANLDTKKLKEITNIVESSNIDEIKFELDDIKISINSTDKKPASQPGQVSAQQAPPISGPVLKEGTVEIKSPIVGTYYASPAPGEPSFVKAGDKVKKGNTLFIIEAMKLMNKVDSEHDGIIEEVLISDEDAVEFDQTIMILKKE